MKKRPNDIDYLHPEGKPKTSSTPRTFEKKLEDDVKSERQAIEEADGHHICSDECHRRHDLDKKVDEKPPFDS